MCIPPACVNFSIEENPKMFLWYIITEKHPMQNTNLDFHKIMRFMLSSFPNGSGVLPRCEVSWPSMCFGAGRPSNLFKVLFSIFSDISGRQRYMVAWQILKKTYSSFNLSFGRSTADFRPKHGDTILTNMMSQADSSSSASVPSLKHHITSLRMFQFFQS